MEKFTISPPTSNNVHPRKGSLIAFLGILHSSLLSLLICEPKNKLRDLGFHGDEDSRCGLLGCDTVQ
jgi:hypothetical protein